jgi:adenosine kinase
MSTLICGSFAFDTIMVFEDKFENHILPDKVHMLNVSFMVPNMRREYGGCAGNIAYNLHLLGGDAIPMGTVGQDFSPYAKWMAECGINSQHVVEIDDSYTAQAFITTDLADNQITAFHPGAMSYAHQNTVQDVNGINIGIVSPDGRDGMIQHAEQFVISGIPFIFDPGQGLPMFNGDELKQFISQAQWITVNDYEWQLMQERTGYDVEAVLGQEVEALIVTRGGKGSDIYTAEKTYHIPAAVALMLIDPTGCGDAYRGGLLFGLQKGLDWETTGRIASLMGTIKIEQAGTQNHHFTMQEFETRYQASFDAVLVF